MSHVSDLKIKTINLKIDLFSKLARDIFDAPLSQRHWDENIGDGEIWGVMLDEINKKSLMTQ